LKASAEPTSSTLSGVLETIRRDDNPAAAAPLPAAVDALYKAARRLDADPEAKATAASIARDFLAFRDLQTGFEQEFEELSRLVKPLLTAVADDGDPIVSWRDPRLARISVAELAPQLAREQSFARLPSGASLSQTAPEDLIDQLIKAADPETVEQALQIRGHDAAFCRIAAPKLYDAGFFQQARRAAELAGAQPAHDDAGQRAALPFASRIFFRYWPLLPAEATAEQATIVLWCKAEIGRGEATSGTISSDIVLRWFTPEGDPLVGGSGRVALRLDAGVRWQPVLIQAPALPQDVAWVRFEAVFRRAHQDLPLGTGFLFGPTWSASIAPLAPDALGFTGGLDCRLLPGVEPVRVYENNSAFTPTNGFMIINHEIVPAGVEMLAFLDWDCFGRRLAFARLPAQTDLPEYQMLLPTSGESRNRIIGY
jgi:hypothetical protein